MNKSELRSLIREEIQNILKNEAIGSVGSAIKSFTGSTEVKPGDKIKLVFEKPWVDYKDKTFTVPEVEFAFKKTSVDLGPKDETLVNMIIDPTTKDSKGNPIGYFLNNDSQLKVGDTPDIDTAGGARPSNSWITQRIKVKEIYVNGSKKNKIHWRQK